tara:strand:- start:600 stop:1424 length:825 start_codon:yes stop_codon:yes gene_type:complete
MLLDPDAIERMQSVMDANPTTVDEASADSTPRANEPVIEAQSSSNSSNADNDVNDNADMQSEEFEDNGSKHRVPYKRFKSVLDARNKYKNEVSDYQSRISHMEEQLQQLRTNPSPAVAATEDSNDQWLDDLLSDDPTPSYSDQGKYQNLEDRLYKFEVQQATVELNKEIASAIDKYPNVPRNLLLQAVVQKPDINVMDVAENYNTYVSSIEEGAVNRYINENGKQTPAAAPRGRSAGSSVNTRNAGHDSKAPHTMKDAKKALLSFMKGNKQFNV